MKIGELLIEEGLITEQQLRYALHKQSIGSGQKVGEILVELGYISAQSFSSALEKQIRDLELP